MGPRRDARLRSRASRIAAGMVALVVISGVSACGTPSAPPADPATPAPGASAPSTAGPAKPRATPRPTPPEDRSPEPSTGPLASDGKPREARLTIPALRIEGLRVQPYRGSPDDAPGTRIQDGGIAASPYGPDGGVGPGGLGNHIVTAHRLSSTQPFLDLPDLRKGAMVHLEAAGKRYTYQIVATRITSFRSPRSLAAQAAPVPGRPGKPATRAMITLSTCRTPEDRAEGNHWSDKFGNPEHRIDKVGELVSVRSR